MGDYCRTGGGIVRDYAEKHLNWAHLEVFSEILKRNLHVQKDLENGSGGRARTDAGTLQPEPLAEAGTQIGTQSLPRDPKLAQVIEAWPRLSPALQAAVLAIVACPER